MVVPEPLTIISTVGALSKTLFSASQSLYLFINATRHVDQSVKDLCDEVSSFRKVTEIVEAGLKSTPVHSEELKRLELWQLLYETVIDCEKTVTRLDETVDRLRKPHSNVFNQTVRQIKLDFKISDIESLKAQIRTHSNTLQVNLQMINIRAAYTGPMILSGDLGSKIDALTEMMKQWRASMTLQQNMSLPLSEILNIRHIEDINRVSSRIMEEANSVYTSSVASGSMLGENLSQEIRLRMNEWIPDPDDAPSSLTSDMTPVFSTSIDSSSKTSHGIPGMKVNPFEDPEIPQWDSDDDFEHEIAEKLLHRGRLAFADRNYAEASNILQIGLEKAEKLSVSRRISLRFNEARYDIGMCKFRLQNYEEAEKELSAFMQIPAMNDADRGRICEATHILSQINMQWGRFDDAEDCCRMAVKGRRRLLGKNHAQYYESLELCAEILEAKGEKHEATVLRGMIPRDNTPEQTLQTSSQSRPSPGISKSERSNDVGLVFSGSLTRPSVFKRLFKGHSATAGAESAVADIPLHVSELITNAQDRNRFVTVDPVSEITQKLDLPKTLRPKRSGNHQPTHIEESAIEDVRGQVASTKKLTYQLRELRGHAGRVWNVAFSPDGATIASGSSDGSVRIWDASTGRQLRELRGHDETVYSVAFSPDGATIASGCGSIYGSVRIWDASTGRQLRRLGGHTERVSSVAFSPDGATIASGSGDGSVRIWDASTGRQLRELGSHAGTVSSVAFSPDGATIASGSVDGSVRIWDASTGRQLRELGGHAGGVWSVAFSPDGATIASGSGDGSVRIWDAETR